MRASHLLVAAAMLTVALVGPAAADHDPDHTVLQERYLAGSVHAHAGGTHQAVGPTDCSGLTGDTVGDNAGGACFDLSDHPEGADLFLRAEDDHSPTGVSLFAGFDLDGDGCVGCVPGQDAAWTGVDSLGADLVDNGTTFAVFVRAVSVEEGQVHVATTGNLTLDVLPDGTLPCGEEGAHREECGEPFKSPTPYPYPCLPDCGASG